jgi:hypothetical protein
MPLPGYDGRKFRSVNNSPSGEADAQTISRYHQVGDVVWATYSGGAIRFGTLIAAVDAAGCLEMRDQHINTRGELMTGHCHSTPEILADGRLRLHEVWQWTSGDHSTGHSTVEEV